MNAGDSFYSEDTLQSLFSHKINDDTEVLYGNTLQEYDFGTGIAKPNDYGNDVMPFCHQSCLVRTETMKRLKFYPSAELNTHLVNSANGSCLHIGLVILLLRS